MRRRSLEGKEKVVGVDHLDYLNQYGRASASMETLDGEEVVNGKSDATSVKVNPPREKSCYKCQRLSYGASR